MKSANLFSFFFSSTANECLSLVEKKYKFYLSFENAFCDDYVTEKFWRILGLQVIPVVLGGANYSEIAPKKSFINVNDFQSPAELAKYLLYLDANVTAYAEYFEWKKYFDRFEASPKVFCNLCEALNDEQLKEKVYSDFKHWWLDESHCVIVNTFHELHVWTIILFLLAMLVAISICVYNRSVAFKRAFT